MIGLVGLVALLVIGPEKLPKAAQIAVFWKGKTRSAIASVKTEIKQELHSEEIRQRLQQQLITDELQQTLDDSNAAINEINATVEALTDRRANRNNDKPA